MKKVVEFTDRKLIEQEAANWLIRLDAEEALSDKNKAVLHEWLDRSPVHRRELTQLAATWNAANVLTELAVPLNPHKSESQFNSSLLLSSKRFASVAASLVLALSIGFFVLQGSTSSMRKNDLIATQVGDQKSIELPDGSVVKLNTNSRVKIDYTDEFRNIRLLKGEAHFDVAKNKDKPFRVYAGSGRIHAIGTAFSVYLKGNEIDVTVSEGRVGVASVPVFVEESSVEKRLPAFSKPVRSLGMLRAGEAGTIVNLVDENSKQIQQLENIRRIENVDIAKELSWTSGVLVFSGEPLNEVVKEISRYTPVSIEFADPDLESIRIGGRFPVGETETMFASLETNFGLKVTRLDSDRVVISGVR